MAKPNFVFIMTDTQGWNMVGCGGRPEMRTPHIDRLAAEGVLFTRAYTTSPVCTPARAGIFTGMYPHTTGAWGNHMPLGDNVVTMGQRFRDLGYRTAYVGKWHLSGHDYFDTGLCPDGWDDDYWYDGKRYLDELTDDEITLWRTGLRSLEALREHEITAAFTWGHRVSDRAIRFLETAVPADEPFVLAVSYDEPHGPWTCPPEYVERFRDFRYDVGPAARDDLKNKPDHHHMWAADDRVDCPDGTISAPLLFGCNSFVDAEIGSVVDAVRRLAPEETWIIYTSDHGDMLGAHGMMGKGPNMYEQITHIPLMIRPPGRQHVGHVDGSLVGHVDLLPTMLELAGAQAPPALVGKSLVPRLLEGRVDPDRRLLIEFNRYEIDHDYAGFQPIRCWMSGDHKLVVNLLSDMDELYDLREDPAELSNLIDSTAHAAIRDRMHDEMLDHLYQVRDPFRGYHWERRPWRTTRRLGWRGKWRPRHDDGYAPPARDYHTGQPGTGARDN